MRYGFEHGASRRRRTPIRYSPRQTRRVPQRMAAHATAEPIISMGSVPLAGERAFHRAALFLSDQANRSNASLSESYQMSNLAQPSAGNASAAVHGGTRESARSDCTAPTGRPCMLTTELFRSPSGVPGHRAPPAHGDEPDPEAVPHADLRPQ